MKELNLEDIIRLRRELHKNAELSGSEKNTSEIIKNFVTKFNPDDII